MTEILIFRELFIIPTALAHMCVVFQTNLNLLKLWGQVSKVSSDQGKVLKLYF